MHEIQVFYVERGKLRGFNFESHADLTYFMNQPEVEQIARTNVQSLVGIPFRVATPKEWLALLILNQADVA